MHTPRWPLRSIPLLLLVLVLTAPLPGAQTQTPTENIEADAPLVAQSGNWTPADDANASGGRYLLNSGSRDDTLSLDFSGSYLEIIYVAAPWTGTLVIEIDGVERRTVNTGGDLLFNQRVVFHHLADEAHTLRVYGVEGNLIAVDAFVTVPRVVEEESVSGTEMVMAPQAVSVLSETKLLASDAAAYDFYGSDVSISGERAIVSARYEDENGNNSGSAYIYERRTDGTWTETKLTASDGAAGDVYGQSVSISGTRAIVGAVFDNENGNNSGSAYIYERQSDGTWTETKLIASDGAQEDYFGTSVDISGERAIVGADSNDDYGYNSGSAYIYERQPNGTWAETKLTAGDGDAGDYFGGSVSIWGGRAIVGAWASNRNGSSGAAYIYERQPNGTWAETKLIPSDVMGGDSFGTSVSIEDESAVVGAIRDDDNAFDSGAAYIYERQSDGTWSEIKLIPSDGAANDFYGGSVSISGERVIVGSYFDDDNGSESGSAYIYERQPNGTWQETKITPVDGAQDDYYGTNVDISGEWVIVSAYLNDDNGDNSGAAYIYELAVPAPPNTNLIVNGNFAAGRAPWSLYGDYQFTIGGGVMQFYRTYPGWSGAQLFQTVKKSFPANAPLEVTLELGNTSKVPKGVEVRLRNLAWTDVITCSVVIPPKSKLTTITMRGLTREAWDDFMLSLLAYDNDNAPAIVVYNVNVQYRPSAGITGFDCDGFAAPANTNLLQNGNFSNGRFYWALWGDYHWQLNNGVMSFYRRSGASRLGNLYTQGAYHLPAAAPVRLLIQIGNSSNVAKEISVILRDSTWAQTFNCTFDVPANTPLTSVQVQGVTNQEWSNPFVMVRALDADGAAYVQVDNAVVQYLPGVSIPNQCGGGLPLAD